MEQAELDEVLQIAMDYFRSQTSSEEEAMKMMAAMAKTIEDQGAKLVHIGKYLFLILVRGKGYVEVHTIGNQNNPRELVQSFELLAKYLKSIGAVLAFTYSPDKKFLRLAKLISLDVQTYEVNVEGQKMNVFMVRL